MGADLTGLYTHNGQALKHCEEFCWLDSAESCLNFYKMLLFLWFIIPLFTLVKFCFSNYFFHREI